MRNFGIYVLPTCNTFNYHYKFLVLYQKLPLYFLFGLFMYGTQNDGVVV